MATDFAVATGDTKPHFYRPVQAIPWGVLNFTNPFRAIEFVDRYATFGEKKCVATIVEVRPTPPSFIVNPRTGTQLRSIRYAFTYDEREPTAFHSASELRAQYSIGLPFPSWECGTGSSPLPVCRLKGPPEGLDLQPHGTT